MAIYAISDLHLSRAVDKPMDIFGGGWENYMDKIEENWNRTVSGDDWVLVCGDLSWAACLEEVAADFEFLSVLPGKKILCKGNHDYWWTTLNKMNKFIKDKGFNNIYFLHNNSFVCETVGVCGTRGWVSPGSPEFSEHDEKIYRRELGRLELSLRDLKGKDCKEVLAMLHYPPFYPDKGSREFLELLKSSGVTKCIYGHIHGPAFKDAVEGRVEGIEFMLTSCDRLGFKPIRLY
jgi:predicted phosphohydrolase